MIFIYCVVYMTYVVITTIYVIYPLSWELSFVKQKISPVNKLGFSNCKTYQSYTGV